MKKKVWVTSPVAYVMVGIMYLMALASLRNVVLCFVELALATVCLVVVLVADRWFEEHITRAMSAARRVLTAEETRFLEKFTLPVAVVANEKDIVWANELFEENVSRGECRGESVLRYIYPYTLRQVMAAENGANTECGGRKYTVYASKTDAGAVLYFIDNTFYKEIHREYREKSPVVMFIAFDNREEMTRDSSSVDDSRIVAQVETVLQNWATQDMNGFMRKLSNSRYVLLSDEVHLQQAKEKRFDVLDEVRRIRNQNLSATVSVGIGRGASSMAEADMWARQALNMALGRGGDQVAVKQNDTYEFFGGRSKGVEKRDKV
ncbi:MAG: DHH family phosphoesterase, partial [Clostridia bacterium]|nr:DHH family phosphoesterase [Clostridia bacterium]